jgi:hypothetical protein
VRIAAWAFVVCTVLGVVGVFVPVVELRVEGVAVAKKGAISLYQASNNSELVRRFIAGYRKSSKMKYGAAILGALEPHAHGKVKGNLDDVHDAMETLDTVDDADLVSGARVFKIGLWVFLSLHVIMGLVIFTSVMENAFSRRRLAIAAACSVLVTAISLGIYWACGEAVFEANDELGVPFVGTSVGTLLIPIAAVLGFVAMTALVVLRIRTRRGT